MRHILPASVRKNASQRPGRTALPIAWAPTPAACPSRHGRPPALRSLCLPASARVRCRRMHRHGSTEPLFPPRGVGAPDFFDPCFFHGTCMPSHPRHQPLAPLAAGKAWRLALAPLALCLAQAAPAQTATETATEAATEASATTPPRLQEVRISADTDNGMGFAPDQAQTAGKAPMRRLETPQSVSVVTREQMESRQITNLQQALQTVAGVSPVNFGRRGFD